MIEKSTTVTSHHKKKQQNTDTTVNKPLKGKTHLDKRNIGNKDSSYRSTFCLVTERLRNICFCASWRLAAAWPTDRQTLRPVRRPPRSRWHSDLSMPPCRTFSPIFHPLRPLDVGAAVTRFFLCERFLPDLFFHSPEATTSSAGTLRIQCLLGFLLAADKLLSHYHSFLQIHPARCVSEVWKGSL